jgi:hypothetical protein
MSRKSRGKERVACVDSGFQSGRTTRSAEVDGFVEMSTEKQFRDGIPVARRGMHPDALTRGAKKGATGRWKIEDRR